MSSATPFPRRERFRFRAECQADVAHLLCHHGWRTAGLALARLELAPVQEGLPDVEVAIDLCAHAGVVLSDAIRRLMKGVALDTMINRGDLHVIVESFKPEDQYDGERNGPYAFIGAEIVGGNLTEDQTRLLKLVQASGGVTVGEGSQMRGDMDELIRRGLVCRDPGTNWCYATGRGSGKAVAQ